MNIKSLARIIILVLIFTVVTFSFSANFVFADNSGARIDNPINSNTFAQFVNKLLAVVLQIGAVVAVFFIIYSGFLFVTARGNEEKLSKAKTAITWTLIGTAILLGARVLVAAVQTTIEQL